MGVHMWIFSHALARSDMLIEIWVAMFFDVRSLLLCDGALVIDDVLALIDLHTSSHGMLFFSWCFNINIFSSGWLSWSYISMNFFLYIFAYATLIECPILLSWYGILDNIHSKLLKGMAGFHGVLVFEGWFGLLMVYWCFRDDLDGTLVPEHLANLCGYDDIVSLFLEFRM